MRIATLSGVLMVLAGCNGLPAEPVNGDNQNLSGSAGAGTNKDESSDKAKNGTAAADPKPACGEDCDASVRACFAKGVDAKTCDAQYHACLGSPAPGDSKGEPANDPNEECVLAAKQCFADGSTPAEKCQAILDSCKPPPAQDPGKDPVEECQIAAKQCFADGSTPAEKCQALLDSCTPPPPAEDPAVECKLEYVKCLEANPDAGTCDAMLEACIKDASGKPAN